MFNKNLASLHPMKNKPQLYMEAQDYNPSTQDLYHSQNGMPSKTQVIFEALNLSLVLWMTVESKMLDKEPTVVCTRLCPAAQCPTGTT